MDSGSSSTHGVVLAGSFSWNHSPLDRLVPRPLLPVAHRPLISYALRWLRQGGVHDVVACLNRASRGALNPMRDAGSDFLGLEFQEDLVPRGPAGCARDAALGTSGDTFVVVDGTVIPTVALSDVMETHRASGAVATVVVEQEQGRGASNRLSHPGGIYVFARRALELVPERGFHDIKENLIPQLYRSGAVVTAHVAGTGSRRVLNASTYLDVNHWAVARVLSESAVPDGYARQGEALVHNAAYVDRRARLLGPVLIGPDSKVMPRATVVGPAVLGTGCTVAADAVVSRTVAWNRCLVGAKAVVDGSVLTDDAIVDSNTHVSGDLVVAARRGEDFPRILGDRVRSIASLGLWARPEAR